MAMIDGAYNRRWRMTPNAGGPARRHGVRAGASGLAFAAAFGLAHPAHADTEREATPTTQRSYAMQIVFAHAIPSAVMWSSAGVGELTKEDAFGVPGSAGGLGTILAPPIVHWSHGGIGAGFASLGGNAIMSVLGFAAGFAAGERACPTSEDNNGPNICKASAYGGLVGMTVGQAFWLPVDVLMAEPDEESAPAPRANSLRLTPTAGLSRAGVWTFGVAGSM